MKTNDVSKKKREFIHVYALLFIIILIGALLTYIIPAGSYDMMVGENGREVIDPETYHSVPQQPVNLMGLLAAIPKGMGNVSYIIFFVFIVGGSFEVLQATGALEAGLGRLTKNMAGKDKFIVPVLTFTFCVASAFIGAAEELIPFVPIMVSLTLALGYDSITGTAIVLSAMGAGYGGAVLNMFTIGTAQSISGLPLFSSMNFRIVLFAALSFLTVTYVTRYASKVKKNPQLSPMYEIDSKKENTFSDLDSLKEFGNREKSVLVVFLLTMILLVIGVIKLGWYITEIAALFLGMTIVMGAVGRLGINGTSKAFARGMAGIASGALVIGFAAGVLVVLREGMIIDTILYGAASALVKLPSSIAAVGMYVLQCFLNFLIPSGSGQAALSMPIMAPLSDIVGVTRQTACIAFQIGDGLSNVFVPTSGLLMASLSMAKLPWNKWAKFMLPLLLIQYLVGAVFVLVAHYMQLGPF